MNSLWIFILIICVSLATYVSRGLPILYLSSRELPEDLKTWMKYIPPAIFAALIVPDIMLLDGEVSIINPKSIAAFIALLVACKTKSMTITIIAGVSILSLLLYL